MKQLTAHQRAIIDLVVGQLSSLANVAAVVLGGSHARGRARPDSDLDLGLYYRPDSAFSIDGIRQIAVALNDTSDPVVAGFGEWGRWVDGGAWLTVEGQRVDLLYRSLSKVEQTLEEALQGRFEVDFEQQPPFGFFGPTLLGEVAIAVPLHDPASIVAGLKTRVLPFPEALACSVVQNRLWSVEFGLTAFAPKFVASGSVYGVSGCLARFANALVLALFALNRTYLVNDKTALAEIDQFDLVPHDFGIRLVAILSAVGSSPEALNARVTAMRALFDDVRMLAGSLYTPPWRFSA
jgi:predicted nucleotidyltransferase